MIPLVGDIKKELNMLRNLLLKQQMQKSLLLV